jgi:inorganic pyrophosphatase
MFPKTFYRWRPHPWHGLEPLDEETNVVNAYIEMTPFDSVKYEVDKATGYLRVDRPQLTSSMPPTLYGFVPRTFCGARVNELSPEAKQGDLDPLDICVITERPISRGEVIVRARVIGGVQMVDNGEADDKLIAVLDEDPFWANAMTMDDIPDALLARLRHYFLTYKLVPGESHPVSIESIYGVEQAMKVLEASMEDYIEVYGG